MRLPRSDEPSFDRSVFASPGPVLRTPMTVTGRFGGDAVEGGCAYLETDQGIRYEVLYPQGWSLLRNPIRLINPDGQMVANGGETITVSGVRDDEMSSSCMIGPILRATAVVAIERTAGGIRDRIP